MTKDTTTGVLHSMKVRPTCLKRHKLPSKAELKRLTAADYKPVVIRCDYADETSLEYREQLEKFQTKKDPSQLGVKL